MKLLEYIARGAAGEAEIMVNPTQEVRRVAAGGVLSLVVVHSAAEPSTLEIELGEGAVLHLVEAFSGGAMGSCRVRQGASSRCEITSVVTGSAEAAAISATRPAPRNAEVTNFEVLDIGFSSRPVSVSSVLASHYSRAKTFVTLSPIS